MRGCEYQYTFGNKNAKKNQRFSELEQKKFFLNFKYTFERRESIDNNVKDSFPHTSYTSITPVTSVSYSSRLTSRSTPVCKSMNRSVNHGSSFATEGPERHLNVGR